VAGPQALEVERGQAAEATHLDRGRGAGDAVHRRGHERQVEPERVDLPRDVDVLGVARAPAGHDGDVIEPVCPSARLADADLDVSHTASRLAHPVETAQDIEPTAEDRASARPAFGSRAA